MSKNLGISQSKIRNLKMRKELQYPRKGFDWKSAFVLNIRNANYDENSKTIKLMVSDVNVLTELRYFMEKNGWYDEYQLNPRLFQCKVDFFMQLCCELESCGLILGDESREVLGKIADNISDNKEKNAIQKIRDGFIQDGLKELALCAGKTVLIETLKAIPFGGILEQIMKTFIEILKK